ncbi:MAG: DUF4124 domain-containing protein [Lysobacter sp.]|nr:DUF4124 domain-containing protein [Lysobacter sp.]
MNARALVPVLLLWLASPAGSAAPPSGEVTIYRCTDAAGHLTLGDSPCPKGQQQQTRAMLRPKDAPLPPPMPSPRAHDEGEALPRERIVYVQPPRPLYECVTPDGERYTSETPEGNPRWVPLWTLGVPMLPYPAPGITGRTELAITHGNVHLSGSRTIVQPPFYVPAAAFGAGTWVRDDCHPLPPTEVCARLRDRRDEIGRRFFNAQPSERDQLRFEERGIDARLQQDCAR